MDLDKIRKKVTGGFKPFMILISDGRHYNVPHPEFILIGSSAVAVTDDEGDIAVIDPDHILTLKDKPAKKRAA